MTKQTFLIKLATIFIFLLFGAVGFSLLPKTEATNSTANGAVVEKISDYRKWVKVNDKPQIMISKVAQLCASPTTLQLENDIHNNKYINVFVNDLGKDEMLTKKNPLFPEGTIIVKEKLSTPESTTPELLTVMIKRKKGFNPEIGDWEFLTFNGAGTEITARGKLESCRRCHLEMKETDYISRNYLPDAIREKLK